MSIITKRRVAPVVLGLGIVMTAVIGGSYAPAVSGFTASINNSNNSIGSGTLLMTETQGATTCLSSTAGTVTATNAGTCSAINKFSGTTVATPGATYTSTVTIKNNGTVPANSFNLTPAGCIVSNNGTTNGTDSAGFCAKVNITISDDTNTKCVYPASTSACAAPTNANTLATLGTTPIALATPLAANASRAYTFTVGLDNSATNANQGLLATEALSWAFAN
jgi:hypothetical protein